MFFLIGTVFAIISGVSFQKYGIDGFVISCGLMAIGFFVRDAASRIADKK